MIMNDVISGYNSVQETPLHTTNLRKVGGSVMLAVPPAVLDMLQLRAGATVALVVDGDRLIVEPQTRRRYTLDELLAQCDQTAEPVQEDREWLDAPPVGRELL
jgi:antitoxin ChpS